jgi:hypothetical protein
MVWITERVFLSHHDVSDRARFFFCFPLKFQVLIAANMKVTVFWNTGRCSPVEIYQVSDVLTASIALMMEAVSTSETSVCFSEISRLNIPEDCLIFLLTWLIYYFLLSPSVSLSQVHLFSSLSDSLNLSYFLRVRYKLSYSLKKKQVIVLNVFNLWDFG